MNRHWQLVSSAGPHCVTVAFVILVKEVSNIWRLNTSQHTGAMLSKSHDVSLNSAMPAALAFNSPLSASSFRI